MDKKPHANDNELLLCFDEMGNVIAPQKRGLVHTKPYKIWHAIVNIRVFNDKGEILCTRRSPSVSSNAGKWQTYVGGHVRADSNFQETAYRELEEEIGLNVNKNDLTLIEKGRKEEAKHIFETYALVFRQSLEALHFNDGEVDDARWVSFKEYQRAREKSPDEWCNSMSEEQYIKIKESFSFSS